MYETVLQWDHVGKNTLAPGSIFVPFLYVDSLIADLQIKLVPLETAQMHLM